MSSAEIRGFMPFLELLLGCFGVSQRSVLVDACLPSRAPCVKQQQNSSQNISMALAVWIKLKLFDVFDVYILKKNSVNHGQYLIEIHEKIIRICQEGL